MVGAGDVEARGAIEVGERDGGSAASRLSRGQGVVWDHAAFPKGKAVEEGGPPYAPESYGAGICGGSAVGRRATV
jgi:hypothetical protein